MKINFNKEKSIETITKVAKITTEAGKKVADGTKETIKTIVKNTKVKAHERKMKELSPVFREKYFSGEFNIPNIIKIVDDAERRDEELCEGAIGYLSKEKDVEIFNIYDEFARNEECGIKFIPVANCYSVYYIDNFDRKRYIDANQVFAITHDEKMAELKKVAYCLGAKSFSSEISVSDATVSSKNQTANIDANYNGAQSNESFEKNSEKSKSSSITGNNKVIFESNENCTIPELKWYANNHSIKSLIEMRTQNKCVLKKEILNISGKSASTMSQKTAYAIDAALGNGKVKGNGTISEQFLTEQQTTMKIVIEF